MSRRPTAALGLAGAACVACCAGPVLGAAGGVAALGVLGTALFGALALVVAVVVVAGLLALARRRHRQTAHRSDAPMQAGPVPVSLGPTSRSG